MIGRTPMINTNVIYIYNLFCPSVCCNAMKKIIYFKRIYGWPVDKVIDSDLITNMIFLSICNALGDNKSIYEKRRLITISKDRKLIFLRVCNVLENIKFLGRKNVFFSAAIKYTYM